MSKSSYHNYNVLNEQKDRVEFVERTYADGSKQRFTIEEYEKIYNQLLNANKWQKLSVAV
jgi:hypothetical protein